MNYFFTADTHFGHKNIIRYDKRPFENTEEHDEQLIVRYNSVVSKNDIVYHLGDFAFASKQKINEYISRLNGKIHLIKGNHDKRIGKGLLFESISDIKNININNVQIVLCHYCFRVWSRKHYGAWHLYGHSHNQLEESTDLCFDVGVPGWNYYPISFEQVKQKMQTKEFKNETNK